MSKEEKPKYAVEYRKGSKWNQNPDRDYRYMECKICGAFELASEETTAVTCHECVIEMCDPIDSIYKKSDKPRGWTLKREFVDKDGNVYHKGKEQPNLKGTLKPTIVEKSNKPSKRMTKREKNELMGTAALNLHKLKIKLENSRWKKDKKPILSEIKLHTKIAIAKFPRNFNREEYLEKYKK